MKNTFKLAAIAVSMVLAAGLVACSSGDDVVDATTPKYLLTAQIAQYVDAIKYDQNVSDAEIKVFKTEHENVMKFIDNGCDDCLAVYLAKLQKDAKLKAADDKDKLYTSEEVAGLVKALKGVKDYYGTKEVFHEACVYKPAIYTALSKVKTDAEAEKKVLAIVEDDGEKIIKGALNDRQAATMKAYTDAAAALKAALNDTDKNKCKTVIDAADKVIEDFGKLGNKNVTKAEILSVVAAVTTMHDEIKAKVYDKLTDKEELEKLKLDVEESKPENAEE